MIGVVTGRRVSKNRDGDKPVLILQVSLIDGEDTRSIEIFSSSDFNPANGTRVYICNVSDSYQVAVATSDGLTPEVEAGEVEIYSTDNPVTAKQARIYLNKDGEIILNQGTDFAVRFSALETAFNQLKSDYDAHTHPYVDTPIGASTTSATAPSTADISGAKIEEILVP
jgi:hypothetical protein